MASANGEGAELVTRSGGDRPVGKRGDESAWESLAIAMLSVGGFSVEKVLGLRASLAKHGLLDPRNLVEWDEARITRELTAAGYDRGLLTGMYAERLSAAMRALAATDRLVETQTLLENADDERISDLLLPEKGIGPKVVASFLRLRRNVGPG